MLCNPRGFSVKTANHAVGLLGKFRSQQYCTITTVIVRNGLPELVITLIVTHVFCTMQTCGYPRSSPKPTLSSRFTKKVNSLLHNLRFNSYVPAEFHHQLTQRINMHIMKLFIPLTLGNYSLALVVLSHKLFCSPKLGIHIIYCCSSSVHVTQLSMNTY